MAKPVIVGLSRGMLMHNVQIEVEDGVGNPMITERHFQRISLFGGGSPKQESKQCFHQLTMTGGSRGSSQAGRAGRGLSVKVNLPIFKDEKTKDVAIFYCSGWNDQHLLLYVLWSLQGFPGDLARSLGEDATLTDILPTLDKHYGMVMTFNAPSKELYSLKQGSRENVAKFRVCLSQIQIL